MTSPIVECRLRLHRGQSRFCNARTLYRGFVGGRGAGKTYVGALDLIRRSKRGRTYLIASPTGILMNDTTFPTFRAIAREHGFWYQAGVRLTPYPTVELANGARVRFRTAEDPERMRGPNLSGVWLDEASLMEREAYTICLATLREGGEQGWLSATFTPKGRGHWTYDVFGRLDEKGNPVTPNTSLVVARTRENPFLPAEFDAAVRSQYRDGSRMTRQELDAEFLPDGLAMFARHWFKVHAVEPKLSRRVRAWDLAATEPKDNNDPDYTVGALVGKTEDGETIVSQIVRDRLSPLGTEKIILSVAHYDGKGTEIVIEQEPGAAAKIYCADLVRKLAGYTVRVRPADGSKAERASPFSSQAEAGHVGVVRSPWNDSFFDECEQFPTGPHDDQVDAVSLGFNHLHERPEVKWLSR